MANINVGRKSGFIVRGGKSRRETFWIGGTAFSQTLVANTTAALVLALSAGALALRPFTIVRTRGIIRVTSDQSGASENYGASYGKAVVSEQANAIGVTAVPTPTTDNASDLWFVYEFLLGRFLFQDATGAQDVGVERLIDSRAMRKVEDGQDVVTVVEGPGAGGGTSGSLINSFDRMLVKLH